MPNTAKPTFDVALMRDDMARKGWMATDLAREASVSDMTVSRFLKREAQTPKTAKKLAHALGRSVSRYLISSRSAQRVA